MNTSKKTNTKKTLLIAMALCFMMPAMAQKTNDKTAFEQLKKKAKEVEQINRRAGSYTQKIDSTVYSYGSKDVLQYDEHFNCTKWSSYYYDELSQFIDYEYDAENRVVSQTTIYPSGNSGFKTTMEYDVAGNLTVQTGYAKQNEEWVETSRMIREYDAVGNLTSETSYGKQDGEWVAQSLDTYEYDSEGHVLFMHEYYMNSTSGSWDEFYYDVHNYTNGLHTEFIAYMTNYEGGFIPHRRITWDYNEQQWCVREEYWDWYQDGGGELAYWILANRYDIVYFDNGNVKERISNMVDWVTGDAFPYEKTVYAYDEHNNVTSTNSYAYSFDTSEWSPLFSTVMEYDQSVSVDNIAGFALLFDVTPSEYWSSGESTSPYKDKLLKITNSVWWEEEDEVLDIYYSTTTNSHEYVDLGLPSGTLWATCNVGADTPEGYGDYFAWGETQPKDTYNWSTYQYCMGSSNTLTKYCNNSSYGYNGFTDDLTTLLPEDDAATINWGNGWRMPTQAEFQELIDNTTAIWTTQNDVNGYLFTASNGNSLFLPATGFRLNSNLYFPGGEGDYWSSSLSAYPSSAWYFYFDSDGYNMGHGHDRYCGRSVRPVRSSSGPSHTTQTVELSTGWNWFSANLEITLNDLKAALIEALPGATNIRINGQNGTTTYNGSTWRGTLNSLDVTQMYMIQVNTSCVLTLTGQLLNPNEHPVTLHNGSNWIGYQLGQSMSLLDAFSGFPVNGDKIISQSATSTFNGTSWRGNLQELTPGMGYMYYSNRTGSVSFIFGETSSHEYVDLGLPSGTLWATCNIGANTPEDYGDYFAWGETQPKDYYDWSTYQYCMGSYNTMTKYSNSTYGYHGFTDNLTTLQPEDDAAMANWGSGWRMPTQAEWQELLLNTNISWTTQNGVSGMLFTASNGNSLFLPAAGYRYDSSLYNAGSNVSYWSSSLWTPVPNHAWYFYFYSDSYYMNAGNRFGGHTVRAVRSSGQN